VNALADYAARLRGLDWHNLPPGRYALPVYASTEDEDTDPPLLGYRTFRRTAPRTTAAGHRLGRDSFTTGATYAAPGVDAAQLAAEIRQQRADLVSYYGGGADLADALDTLLLDARHGDTCRATSGRITGKCGNCGRRLTDPASKLSGIGPECRRKTS